ncbi:Uncharacterized protein AB751O23_AI_00110 [Chlamydiales bacterium SCGC AB-751-O23]|jgi:phospholipid/cholesterol/gamma-HCH transport system substrate-binding protein|nr:Uncharacterized protein AB751O23_AI_00110 [Chlamydiales bacterium SCGC AB-751-O23]
MSERFKTFMIGLFVLCALSISFGVILFLKPSYGDGESTLRVRFPTIEKVSSGTRVTFAGKPVGEVIAINEIREARAQKKTYGNQVYFFELVLSIDSSIEVYETDDIVIQTSGLFGEKMIAILPKPHMDDQPAQLVNDKIIYSKSASSIQETIKQMTSFADSVQEALSKVSDFLSLNNNELKETITSFHTTIKELNVTLNKVNENNIISSVNEAAVNFSGAMSSIQTTFDHANEQGLVGNMSNIVNGLNDNDSLVNSVQNFNSISVNLDKVMKSLGSTEGSLGRIIHSEDFYLRMISFTNKMEVLLNDVNHYGLLFHLDKGWQRTRTKRRNLLDTLSTPEHFQRYYEEEMDQISTALSRTSLLLNKAEKEKLHDDEDFKTSFSDLLRRVEALRASLKVYTEDLVEPDGKEL